MTTAIIVIIIAIALSSLFSATEAALLGFSSAKMYRQQHFRRAKIVLRMAEHKERAVAGILIGNNLVNILASSLATSLFIDAFGDIGVLWATLTMTLTILLLAEIIPKTIAIKLPEQTIRFLAPPVAVWLFLLTPFLFFLRPSTTTASAEDTEEELRGSIDLHRSDPSEGKMLHSVLDLDTAVVEDVMTHRRNVVMLDKNAPLENIMKTIRSSSFTRYPVYDNSVDNLVGVVHLRDLLFASAVGDWSENVLTPPWFVPELTVLRDQLTQFRTRRQHFALVVDEYGGFQGVVTLEDVLEVIVGEIDDEHDGVAPVAVTHEGESYRVLGDTPLRALRRDYDWVLEEDDAVTLAGLIIRRTRVIPEVGRVFVVDDFRFEILQRDGYRLTDIRVTPPKP
ncbi:MAG: CNNM domain-containing protein [Alphaproteobacteria bacterium]|nr:CNNM domain-containing protein [Alphaproteobacteria bacterium]